MSEVDTIREKLFDALNNKCREVMDSGEKITKEDIKNIINEQHKIINQEISLSKDKLIKDLDVYQKEIGREIQLKYSGLLSDLSFLIERINSFSDSLEKKFNELKNDNFTYRSKALYSLTSKAILTSNEIIALLKAGFPDGALGRWRTLYEISICIRAIVQSEESARWYIGMEPITAKNGMVEYNKFCKHFDFKPFSEDEFNDVNYAVSMFEQDIGIKVKDYGWSIPLFRENGKDVKGVNFTELERLVGMEKYRSLYKWANEKIHAQYKSDYANLASNGEANIYVTHASSYGFIDPIQYTGIILLDISSCMKKTFNEIDSECLGVLITYSSIVESFDNIRVKILEESNLE